MTLITPGDVLATAIDVTAGARGKRLSVVHVSPYVHPAWAYGDVPRDVFELARAQAAAGHTVTVLTTDAQAPHERMPAGAHDIDGVQIVRVRNLLGLPRDWLGLSTPMGMRRHARRLFGERQAGIVHLHELRTIENLLLVALIPDSVPVVLSTHSTSILARPPAWLLPVMDRFATRRVLARVDHVIVLSASEVGSLRALGRAHHVRLVSDQFSVMPVKAAEPSTARPDRAQRTAGMSPAVAAVEEVYERARRRRTTALSDRTDAGRSG